MDKLRKISPRIWLLVCLGTVAVVIVLAMYYRGMPPRAECEGSGLMVPSTLTLDGFVKESKIIGTGKVEHIHNSEVAISMAEIMSGRGIKRNASITLCQPQVDPTRIKVGDNVLVFLKGKDSDVWALTWPYDGLMTIEDGYAKTENKRYSLDDVRRAIDKAKYWGP